MTENGMELLTKVPRTIEEIEELMREGKKLDVHFPQQKFQLTQLTHWVNFCKGHTTLSSIFFCIY